MNLKNNSLFALTVFTLLMACVGAPAQLPAGFPTFTATTYQTNAVSPGYIFLATDYVMMLQNDGAPFWYANTPLVNGAPLGSMDFKLLPNGYLHYADLFYFTSTAATEVHHRILDNSSNLVETIDAGNGYVAEGHDFQLLPNGNALVLSYYDMEMDLGKYIPGGWPSALVSGACIQEMDSQRNVVWQWRAWDHYAFNPARFVPLFSPLNPVQIAFHINTVTMDTDGNLLISNVPFDVEKINRQTGEVMWVLGGPFGQFTFLNETAAEAAPHFACHDVNRLANGDILLFCDGDLAATRSSKVYEYQIDEVNLTAKLIWSYSPNPPVYSWNAGSAQRMTNGNTVIGWGSGGAVPGIGAPLIDHEVPAITEVDASGNVVYQMWFNDTNASSYRAFRFPYPPQAQAVSMPVEEIARGNTYSFGPVGVSFTATSGGGAVYNSMTVTREPFAPVYPVFDGKPPRVLPVRVSLAQSFVNTLGADFQFDVASFGFNNPTNLTVYYRNTTGQGLFQPQTNNAYYDPATGKLVVSLSLTASGADFGEIIFGYPDIAEVPYAPILNAVENYRGVQPYNVIAPAAAVTGMVYSVNQQRPISLSWSPRGFAAYYVLRVDTNQDFSHPVVDVEYQTDAYYVWTNAAPATTYYYEVRTVNDAGTGPWAASSFQTAAPSVQVTSPSGGEAWRRGLAYFIQWNDNLAESVRIDLYKGGALLMNLTTNAQFAGAYQWSIPSTLTPGSDYSIQITSTTNSAMSSSSAHPFSIVDPPAVTPGSLASLPNGRVQFSITAPGAASATVLLSTNLSAWIPLQTLTVSNGTARFIDNTSTNDAIRFYRLRVP